MLEDLDHTDICNYSVMC